MSSFFLSANFIVCSLRHFQTGRIVQLSPIDYLAVISDKLPAIGQT